MAAPVLRFRARILAAALIVAVPPIASAEFLIAPGDLALRLDLQQLNDSGAINMPMTSWPIASADIAHAIASVDADTVGKADRAALNRVSDAIAATGNEGTLRVDYGVSASLEPVRIRTFENTPRDEGELNFTARWQSGRVAVTVSAAVAANPIDGDEFRPDGTTIAVSLGNWIVSAGWQDRWFGPGRDGSLILGTNARPTPGIALQRAVSRPFQSRWLSWLGPWTFSTFMSELNDRRTINDARLFGMRGSARPLPGFEIGLTRTAQWCGDGRPCDLSTFGDLLAGNDNRGVNVSPDEEPGNQLGGIDMRWSLPGSTPMALYMQWIGEDGRGGGGAVGSWLRLAGIETWGTIGESSHRTHIEVADTTCQEGGFGFSGAKPNCAYEHSIYQTGYRYQGRSLAHPADGDSRSYSIGSTLVQSAGHVWNATLRYMEINRQGQPAPRHTLSPTPQKRYDLLITHERSTSIGGIHAGLGYQHIDGEIAISSESGLIAFLRWTSK